MNQEYLDLFQLPSSYNISSKFLFNLIAKASSLGYVTDDYIIGKGDFEKLL